MRKNEEIITKIAMRKANIKDLYDKELQDSYGVMTPEDLVYAMVDDAGEYQRLSVWLQKFQGFDKSMDEKVDEAKN